MKFILNTIKHYWLTLVTMVTISCLTLMDFSDIKRTESIAHLDKVVHFVMYFWFCAIFWFESLKQSSGIIRWYMILDTIIFPIAFGGIMEYLQYAMTSYRTGDLMDFVYNIAGVLCAVVFSICVTRPLIRKFKKRRQGQGK